jgi:DNA-binding response OmpR family regulator
MRIDEAQLEQSIISIIKSKDRGVETAEILKEISSSPTDVKEALDRLKIDNKLDSHKIGKHEFWYALSWTQPKNILVVEDDKNIAKLLELSIGKDYNIKKVYDGETALKEVPIFKPDMILLDIMLPGIDGLEVCKKLKQDPQTKNIIIVIVSAADAAITRFKGINLGADFYIKKPFEPSEIKALTNIFMKKFGNPFDPLTDLPDVARLITQINDRLNQKNVEFTRINIEKLDKYEEAYTKKEAKKIVRLVSQMLQDKIKEAEEEVLIAYLGGNAFLLAADTNIDGQLKSVEADFKRASNLIKQKYDISDDLFKKIERGQTKEEISPMYMTHFSVNIPSFKASFEKEKMQIEAKLKEATELNIAAVQNYSLDQIRSLFEKSEGDLDVSIKEVGGNVRITAGRKKEQ